MRVFDETVVSALGIDDDDVGGVIHTEPIGNGFSSIIEDRHLGEVNIHFPGKRCEVDWRHVYELMTAAQGRYGELKNLVVWNKSNGGMGSFYRSKHEFIAVYKHGSGPHTNNIELGRFGRNRTNVWDYAGVNTFRPGRMDDLEAHPTVKPLRMVVDAILDASDRGDAVLDPFLGSGTTLLACEDTGRVGYGMEPFSFSLTIVDTLIPGNLNPNSISRLCQPESLSKLTWISSTTCSSLTSISDQSAGVLGSNITISASAQSTRPSCFQSIPSPVWDERLPQRRLFFGVRGCWIRVLGVRDGGAR